ncbi:MAG: hypothetical protein AB7E27_00715 [Candidatus Methanomethylophilaceae archaeon]
MHRMVIFGHPFAYPFPTMQKTDTECGFPVQKHGPGEGRVKRFALPAGKAAKPMHVDPSPRGRLWQGHALPG